VLAEEAQARIDASARARDGLLFTGVRGNMEAGSFLAQPRIFQFGERIDWKTKGDNFPRGDERGTVTAGVEGGWVSSFLF
jgi:hypothetical protein